MDESSLAALRAAAEDVCSDYTEEGETKGPLSLRINRLRVALAAPTKRDAEREAWARLCVASVARGPCRARRRHAVGGGRDRTGAVCGGRSIAVLHADIGKALLASWPGEPEDLSEGDATIGEDRPCFTGSKEATIAKLAAADPALAADVARANGVGDG